MFNLERKREKREREKKKKDGRENIKELNND